MYRCFLAKTTFFPSSKISLFLAQVVDRYDNNSSSYKLPERILSSFKTIKATARVNTGITVLIIAELLAPIFFTAAAKRVQGKACS